MSGFADKSSNTPASPLVRKIYRACRSSLIEPDISLNLAVADYVNEKQGNTPREAAVTIVKLINSKDSHTAIFALSLLDVLVKNCGYPFHLQISRKEFLNELVKRFPERPPVRYTRPQRLILGAIEEWNQTICKSSRYKEDLGFIRDMHRLLSYKGYVFPEVKPEDASVLTPSDNLKSIEEVRKEEQIAQAAKLQELVRRGRPSDLKEANKLMKIMAGFKDDNLVESRAQVAEDLDRLKRKADIFNEMLQTSERSGRIDTSDETLVELYSSLKVAQPKIQKIITEEADDETAVQDLLKINDTVNSLIQKYNLLKAGNVKDASKVKISSTGSAVQDSLNLIDFDDDSAAQDQQQSANGSNVDDLLGELGSLSFSSSTTNNNYGLGGSITLGSPSPQPQPAQPQQSSAAFTGPNYDIFNQLSGNSLTTPQQSIPTTTTTTQNAFPSFGTSLLGSTGPAPNAFQTQPPFQAEPRTPVNESVHLKIQFAINREGNDTIKIKAFFSNIGVSPITDLTFLVAVPKAFTINLEAQSGSFLAAKAVDGITQVIHISGATQGTPVKIKWKVDYGVNGTPVEETSTLTLPTV